MRKLTALLLAFIIFSQAFFNAWVLGYWLMNRSEIAATLCENKDKPALHCDGKCYLKKKIAEAPDTTPTNDCPKPLNLKKGIELAELLPQLSVCPPPIFSDEHQVLFSGNQVLYDFLAVESIFHPPPFCATA